MASIKIKGRRDPLIVTDEQGTKLREMWLSSGQDKKINVGTWSGLLSDIRSIEVDPAFIENWNSKKYTLTPDEQRRADAARERLSKLMREGGTFFCKVCKKEHTIRKREDKDISFMNPLHGTPEDIAARAKREKNYAPRNL